MEGEIMSKAEEREAIKQAMENYKKPIRIVTKEEEIDELGNLLADQEDAQFQTDQSMHDGENRMISNYHHQDGTVGPRFY